MSLESNLNNLNQGKFISLFGVIFEKTQWIAEKLFELIRYGASLNSFLENIKVIEDHGFKVTFSSTISNLSIFPAKISGKDMYPPVDKIFSTYFFFTRNNDLIAEKINYFKQILTLKKLTLQLIEVLIRAND